MVGEVFMKKIPIFLCAGLLALSMSACGLNKSSNNASFNDDLEFVKEYNAVEVAALQGKIYDQLKNVTKQTINYKSVQNYDLQSYEVKESGTCQFFANNYSKMEVSSSTTETSNGITETEKNSTTQEKWENSDKSVVCSYISSETNGEVEENFSRNIYDDSSKETYIATIYSSITSLMNYFSGSYSIYEDAKGNIYSVISYISESYSAVAWGNDTKELHELTRSQTIAKVNSKYQIVSLTYYEDYVTNQDPSTDRWYGKDVTVEKSTASMKLTYGTRKNNESRVSELNNYTDGEYLYSVSLNGMYGLWDNETSTYTAGSTIYAESSNITRTSFTTYHCEAYFEISLTSSNNTIYFNANISYCDDIGTATFNNGTFNFLLPDVPDGMYTATNSDGVELLVSDEAVSLYMVMEFDVSVDGVNNISYNLLG